VSSADRRVVLDASALVAWVLNERGGTTIDKLLHVAVAPASGVTETLYRARDRGSTMSAHDLYDSITGLGVEIEPVTAEDTVRAAELIETSRRARQRPKDSTLSLGDGLCIAVSERLKLVITGGDEHWATLSLKVAYKPFR
jgi:ribonuclease VapC